MDGRLRSPLSSMFVIVGVMLWITAAAPVSQTLTIDNVSVAATGGTFEFSNLTAKDRNTLTGIVRNGTSHDWFIAEFAIVLFDKNGKPVRSRGPLEVTVIGVAAGHEERFDTYLGGVDLRKVGRIEFQFLPSSQKSPRFVVRVIKPQDRPDLALETRHVSLKFIVSRDHFDMSLTNKSESAIELDWNTASLVDTDGKAHRVIRDGVKLIDRDKPQIPDVIPPGASIDRRVVSVDSIQPDPGPTPLNVRPFLQVNETTAQSLKGKTFGVFLPLRIDGNIEQLFVTFLIQDVLL